MKSRNLRRNVSGGAGCLSGWTSPEKRPHCPGAWSHNHTKASLDLQRVPVQGERLGKTTGTSRMVETSGSTGLHPRTSTPFTNLETRHVHHISSLHCHLIALYSVWWKRHSLIHYLCIVAHQVPAYLSTWHTTVPEDTSHHTLSKLHVIHFIISTVCEHNLCWQLLSLLFILVCALVRSLDIVRSWLDTIHYWTFSVLVTTFWLVN